MNVVLKPLHPRDFEEIVKWVNTHDEDFMVQWAGSTYQYPLSVEQMNNHYSRGINSLESDVFMYKIALEPEHAMVGTIQLCKFVHHPIKEAVLGRFLIHEEQHRGRGIGRAALLELLRVGFEQFGLNRIRLNVYDLNERAIKCYESVGFQRIGYKENVYRSQNGLYWANIEMAIENQQKR